MRRSSPGVCPRTTASPTKTTPRCHTAMGVHGSDHGPWGSGEERRRMLNYSDRSGLPLLVAIVHASHSTSAGLRMLSLLCFGSVRCLPFFWCRCMFEVARILSRFYEHALKRFYKLFFISYIEENKFRAMSWLFSNYSRLNIAWKDFYHCWWIIIIFLYRSNRYNEI